MNDGNPDVAQVGSLIAEPERAEMLMLLLDERGRTATELAAAADISRAAASFHLNQLMEGGLVRVARQGRHRYFRLAGPEIAGMLDSQLAVSGAPGRDVERFGPRDSAMRRARMCYDHLAGELGFGITDSLVRSGALIEDGENFQLTERGERAFQDLGIDVQAARRKRRYFARTCLDWSERRPHLAGALGAALADRLLDLGWISREPDSRTVHITPVGHRELQHTFEVNFQLIG